MFYKQVCLALVSSPAAYELCSIMLAKRNHKVALKINETIMAHNENRGQTL